MIVQVTQDRLKFRRRILQHVDTTLRAGDLHFASLSLCLYKNSHWDVCVGLRHNFLFYSQQETD